MVGRTFWLVVSVLLIGGTGGFATAAEGDYTTGIRCVGAAEVPSYGSGLFSYPGYEDLVLKGYLGYAFQAYVGLRVIDLNDPTNPTNRGLFAMENYESARLAAIDHFVVIQTSIGITIIDVEDEDHPVYAAHLLLPGQPRDLALASGRHLYVASDDAGLLVVSLANPTAPQLVAEFDLGTAAERVVCEGTVAAVVTADRMLHLLDATVPDWPVRRGSVSVGPAVGFYGLSLEGHLVVVGKGNETTVIDVTDPDQPSYLGALQVGGYGAAIIDGVAYLSSRGYEVPSGLWLYDLTGGSKTDGPRDRVGELLTWWPLPAATNDHALLSDTDLVITVTQDVRGIDGIPLGLQVLERRSYCVPTPTGEVVNTYAEIRYEAVFREGMCYIAKGDDLGVFDVHDVAAPVYVQDIPGGIECIDVTDDHLFTAKEIIFGNNRFASWSLADPADPAPIDLLVTENYRPDDLMVHQGAMYVTRHDGGLEIIDVREPAAMVPAVSQMFPDWQLNEMREFDGRLWIGADHGLLLVDATHPFLPVVVNTFAAVGELRQLAWRDGRRLAFLAVDNDPAPDTWEVWDVTDVGPGQRLVQVVQPFFWEANVRDVCWHDGVVYVAGDWTIDVYLWPGDTEPVRIGMIPEGGGTDGQTRDVPLTLSIYEQTLAIFGGHDRELRLRPLQHVMPTGIAMPISPSSASIPSLDAAPNPFNPRTRFSFAGIDGGSVELTVFDARGRRVRTLLDEVAATGPGIVVWDGCDDRGRAVAAGVYLVRLQTDSDLAVRRVALIR